jgi:hypothetical protein
MSYMIASGYGLMLEEPSLIGLQPPREVIYTDREKDAMTSLFGDNPSTIDNYGQNVNIVVRITQFPQDIQWSRKGSM